MQERRYQPDGPKSRWLTQKLEGGSELRPGGVLRPLAFLTVAALAASLASPAQAHFLPHKKHLTLEQKIAYYKYSIEHDKTAIHRDLLRLKELYRRDRVLTAYTPYPVVNVQRFELVEHIRFHHAAWAWQAEMLKAAQAQWLRLHPPPPPNNTEVICLVFGSYCAQALRVAWCESKYYTGATNGQYYGLFQMGTHERATYGDGFDAWSQARAAYKYFVASGRDWSPWSCKP